MTHAVIAALEAELRAAQLAGDVPTLDRLISDDLQFTGPDGAFATKAGDLAAYRDGVMRVTEHQPGIARYTRVWARESGEWRIVAGTVSVTNSDHT
ncbi:MAG: hypothetical protein JWO05_902 [Gemmatimonadetes bacterium]|nr:hypothetical protein [Gemmatimonadota bacterium]